MAQAVRQRYSEMKQCRKFYGSQLNQSKEQRMGETLQAIKKCIKWKPLNTPAQPQLLGEGGFGLVVGLKLKSRSMIPGMSGTTRNVAIKIQTVSRGGLSEINDELHYGRRLQQLNLGPQIYKAFYYPLQDAGGVILKQYRVIIIMERGIPANKILFGQWGRNVPFVQSVDIFRRMLQLVESVTENNIFCRDIKPDNFIALVNAANREVAVKMIDFGGNFCQNLPPTFIREIQQYAQAETEVMRGSEVLGGMVHPKLQGILRETSQKGENYPKYLFSRVIQISLILQVFKEFMWQLKSMDPTFSQACLHSIHSQIPYCRYIKNVMQAAAPIVNEVCSDDTLLHNMTEALSHSYTLFEQFMHYVNPKKLETFTQTVLPDELSIQREMVLDEFKNVCMIDKWLRDIPRRRPQPKSGIRAAISRRLRGVKQPPARTLPIISAATPLSGGCGKRKKTRRRKRRSVRRRSRRRGRRRRRRKSRKKKH